MAIYIIHKSSGSKVFVSSKLMMLIISKRIGDNNIEYIEKVEK
jgi:hypothetical protein